MGNLSLAYANLADDAASIVASSALTLAPASRLQNPHVARKWRTEGGASAFLIIDLGGSYSVDTFALLGMSGLFGSTERNLSSAAVTRVRLSSADTSGQAGDVFDSTSAAGRIDEGYGALIVLMDEAESGRYVRIDFSEAGASFLEAGRLFIGTRHEFEVNFAPGWSRAYVDRTRKTEGRGGQVFMDVGESYRTIELNLEFVSEDERNGVVEEIDRVNGEHVDMLVITDPDSDNLGRDCLWSFIDGNRPVIQPYVIDVFTKSYRFRERL